MKNENSKTIPLILKITALVCICVGMVVFEVLYILKFTSGFVYEHRLLIMFASIFITVFLGGITVFFGVSSNEFAYRMCILTLIICPLLLTVIYVMQATNFWDKIDSVDDLRAFISRYDMYAVPVFLLIQILQVVVLPIPGVIAVGAGVAMFGAFWGAVYSFIGIVTGSLIAFYIGRFFGYKVASWLVGKQTLSTTLQLVKGKDKIILTTMFLFPFFPDDCLCFVSGLSSMSQKYFIVMVIITRLISVFTTAYSLDGQIIPYTTWWGIAIWLALITATFILTSLIYKRSDKIQRFIRSKLGKKSSK